MTWTPEKLKRLKKALKDRDRNEVIVFEGYEILVSYGRYLVEYLEGVFKP
jgi:hypothetical protein